MAGIDEAFWDQLDARIAATIVRAPHRRRSRTPAPRARISLPPVEEEAVADRHVVSDWTGLVETISAAGAAAQQQDTRLRAQNAAYEALGLGGHRHGEGAGGERRGEKGRLERVSHGDSS